MNSLWKFQPLAQFYYNQIRLKCDFFITTPIYYVNSSPHIGHLYSSLLADASSRYQYMIGKKQVIFSTGTDEHGTKVQQAANNHGEPLNQFCANISNEFNKMNKNYYISYTDFIRTSNLNHMNTVKHFWKVLTRNGHISKGSYKGWYCDADEAFLTDHQISVVKDNNGNEIRVSTESGRIVNWVEEQNYKFNLPKFKNDLKYWLNKDTSIKPERFRREVLQWIDENVLADEEISISRPKSRVHWAISVPEDDEHTIYVWFDALINYLTTMGYPDLIRWPPDIQIIGKDILKFHAIYWPAFLIAADLEPPHTLMVHSHWTVDGEKMSKSKGNIVCPFKSIEKYGVDGMRYFLLREGTPHSDSNYSDTKLLRVVNSELADTLGNLLNRCCGNAVNPRQQFPSYIEEDFNTFCREQARDLISIVDSLSDEVNQYYTEFNYYKGIALIMSAMREANRHFENERPWILRKSQLNEDIKHLNALLFLIMESMRICAILLNPIVPNLATKLLDKLGVPPTERLWINAKPIWLENQSKLSNDLNNEKVILFKRLEASSN